jgi:hypothetical protein
MADVKGTATDIGDMIQITIDTDVNIEHTNHIAPVKFNFTRAQALALYEELGDELPEVTMEFSKREHVAVAILAGMMHQNIDKKLAASTAVQLADMLIPAFKLHDAQGTSLVNLLCNLLEILL